MDRLAHYDSKSGEGEPLREHLLLVARRAMDFAEAFSASEEAYVAALLHDLGKYDEPFQRRLRGEVRGVDHWSAGAWHALQRYRFNGIASAVAIEGHHTALKEATDSFLKGLSPEKLRKEHPLGLLLSYATAEQLSSENISLPPEGKFMSLYKWGMNNAGSMLDIRMLFSVLVDADYLETEAWFHRDENGKRRYRKPSLTLDPHHALDALRQHVNELAIKSMASAVMKDMRNRLFSECLASGQERQGIFTLTAPTGSGKTLAMLAFALAHSLEHNLRRVVVVLPYLTLIEQTAAVYRQVFEKFVSSKDMDRYLLEHHSLSGVRRGEGTEVVTDNDKGRWLAENWDAPVIVTTSVQFLESLFSSHPSACRKLHRLARSVVLFDEVQTLPLSLIIPTLGTVSRLVERYGTSVVFATATQPAFSHLDNLVKKHCEIGWQPREILPDVGRLFAIARRNRIVLPQKTMNWDELAEEIGGERQVLCVVNLKRQARLLFEKLKVKRCTGLFHLSTNMCPAHRQKVLETVQKLLRDQSPCCLVSTQCVEAGVDIDFPVVYRSMGPLDAIVQAAGRCNRSGRAVTGAVYVFLPEEEGYPNKAYEQATSVTKAVLMGADSAGMEVRAPEIFERYYRELYSVRGIDRLNSEGDELLNAILRQDFADVCRLYRVIPQDTINVLVPYNKEMFLKLKEEANSAGLNRGWITSARPYTVSLFRPRSPHDHIYLNLEPVSIRPDRPEESDEWYIYRKEEDYDPDTGLNPSLSPEVIIA